MKVIDTLDNINSGLKNILLFKSAKVLCGIDVLDIQEVRKDFEITPVPLAPSYVTGIMNLRGEIATVFDLSSRLDLPSKGITEDSQVIVLKVRGGEFQGLLVDEIDDVLSVNSADISQPGHLSNIDEKFVAGICKQEEDLVALLNLETILS
ncbi:MAG: purine-binding chemotaxis protein CheW [Fibrobacter sp.]|nr:purine-binding chemotaxis protein CheW [Fibrobacter sp.]